ncbi:MAG: hypothetical protein JSU63_06480 [Phycisphaerales bacterium]|nr:MAG: hypothetical protein JSU63_06480 [Phycisphaerales bacterium]
MLFSMKIPAIANPDAYAGLYVYDFKTHVSVGYTALEIRYLRESEAHRGGTAYEIYRVTESGTLELRGVLDERLAGREAMCFLRNDAEAARTDYAQLLEAAERHPLPCLTELWLTRVATFDPPHLTALLYPASASNALSGWLGQVSCTIGDRVVGGLDVHAEIIASDVSAIETCSLPSLIDYSDRSVEHVLEAVKDPLQR